MKFRINLFHLIPLARRFLGMRSNLIENDVHRRRSSHSYPVNVRNNFPIQRREKFINYPRIHSSLGGVKLSGWSDDFSERGWSHIWIDGYKRKWGRQNIELAEDTQLDVCFDGFLVAAEKREEVLEEENHSNKSSSSPLTDTGISCTLAVERAEETTRQLSVRLRTVNVHCQFVPSRGLFGPKVFHSCANNERTT